VHAGDVIRAGTNAYGGAVNIASRVCDASRAGEILVTDVLRGLARTSADVGFEDRGEHTLKGVSEPVRLFAVTTTD
jgi:adenylate cyclase